MDKFLPTAVLIVLSFALGMGVVHAAKGEVCEVIENSRHSDKPQATRNVAEPTSMFIEPTGTIHA